MSHLRALLLIATLACAAAPASAQTMYRCGNAYQDHPCGGGQQGQVIGVGAGPASAQASGASTQVSAQCSQRGAAAQKIKWMREAGKTRQEQLAAAGGGDAELIADVYGRHGTSVEVRSAVEADCMDEQVRAEQAAVLEAAASRLRAGNRSTGSRIDAGNGNAAPVSATAAATPSTPVNVGPSEAATRQATCQRLGHQLDDINTRQRASNSAPAMEALRRQYRDLSDSLRKAGC